MRAYRTLRSRLFSWFVGAILLAIVTGSLVGLTTRPEPLSGAEAMARHLGDRFAHVWDDADATREYAEEVRDVTGFDAEVVRDPHRLPARVRRTADRGGAFALEGPVHLFIPVVRGGVLVGAVEMGRFSGHSAPWGWWRFVLVLVLVGIVLSVMAGAVADQLARPLERLAMAADRFGSGDLSVRAEAAGGARRWVAREVRDVAVRFNRMAERVEAMVRGQRELLGAISHELRSPLGRARIALEIARDRIGDGGGPVGARTDAAAGLAGEGTPRAAAGTALDEVEKQLGAVDAILGDLLDLTRAGLADLRPQTRAFVPWLRDRIAEEPVPPSVAVQVDAAIEDQPLAFDPALLARVVHNLLVNARAHGHPVEAPVDVRVEALATRPGASRGEERGHWIRVVVRDRGAGFPAGFADRAFEPFVRGDAARSRPKEGAGYGLGLTIVRRIVEAHGGRVFARNAGVDRAGAAGGAEVGFELPRERAPL
ncbi:MAG TPA: ATP-binding protein [Polyangiaceae bacterium]|jgi:two-component system OmpR family sensor kinase|nr:ATP-binding protein [Polyangiaceae bacterium]